MIGSGDRAANPVRLADRKVLLEGGLAIQVAGVHDFIDVISSPIGD